MAKRPAGPAADKVEVDAPGSKKAKEASFKASHRIQGPLDTSPALAELDPGPSSKRALRTAKAAATRTIAYRSGDFKPFVKLFAPAVKSICAKENRPVTMNEVVTELIATTRSKPKLGKALKRAFVSRGLREGLWQVSRVVEGKQKVYLRSEYTQIAHDPRHWRFVQPTAAAA